MENSQIAAEVDSEIAARYRYSRFDFVVNHLLILLGVIASAFPGFAEIFGLGDSKTVALIAAVPAFVLLVQRTFKLEQRAEWHWDYRRRLIAIRRELRDQGLEPAAASRKLNQLEADLAGSFPGTSHPGSREQDG